MKNEKFKFAICGILLCMGFSFYLPTIIQTKASQDMNKKSIVTVEQENMSILDKIVLYRETTDKTGYYNTRQYGVENGNPKYNQFFVKTISDTLSQILLEDEIDDAKIEIMNASFYNAPVGMHGLIVWEIIFTYDGLHGYVAIDDDLNLPLFISLYGENTELKKPEVVVENLISYLGLKHQSMKSTENYTEIIFEENSIIVSFDSSFNFNTFNPWVIREN